MKKRYTYQKIKTTIFQILLHYYTYMIMIIDSAEKVQCDMIYGTLWSMGLGNNEIIFR